MYIMSVVMKTKHFNDLNKTETLHFEILINPQLNKGHYREDAEKVCP